MSKRCTHGVVPGDPCEACAASKRREREQREHEASVARQRAQMRHPKVLERK